MEELSTTKFSAAISRMKFKCVERSSRHHPQSWCACAFTWVLVGAVQFYREVRSPVPPA
jgi:hypothetical protein